MTIELIVNIIGWIGALSLLVAYLLISSGKTHGKTYLYQSLNLIGSGGFIINSYYYGALPSVALNIIWMIIGIYTILKLLKIIRKTENEHI
ncbi:MAG: hypothetical protein JKY84_08910 [Emcibacteraceae bacterium]|nr:hypothetical protein [Emcibacteraceae bacterium]